MSRLDPVTAIAEERRALNPAPHQYRGEAMIAEQTHDHDLDAARRYASLAVDARRELRRRIDGVRLIFGPEAAESLGRALDEESECSSESTYYFDQVVTERGQRIDEIIQRGIGQRSELMETIARYRQTLQAAADAEDDRYRRSRSPRRTLADWIVEARAHNLLNDQEPF